MGRFDSHDNCSPEPHRELFRRPCCWLKLALRSPEGIRALQKDDVASLGRPQALEFLITSIVDHVMRKYCELVDTGSTAC